MRFTTIKYSCRLLIGIFVIVLSTFYVGCNDSSDTSLSVDYLLEDGLEVLETNIDYGGVKKSIEFELYQLAFSMPLVFEKELITHFSEAQHFPRMCMWSICVKEVLVYCSPAARQIIAC